MNLNWQSERERLASVRLELAKTRKRLELLERIEPLVKIGAVVLALAWLIVLRLLVRWL